MARAPATSRAMQPKRPGCRTSTSRRATWTRRCPSSGSGRRGAGALVRRAAGRAPARRRAVFAVRARARDGATAARSRGHRRRRRADARDERLREKEFGVLDRLTRSASGRNTRSWPSSARHVGKFYFRPPGGESWCDVILRLRSVLDMVTREHGGERVLIVAHQVIVNCLRYLLERMDEAQILAIDGAATCRIAASPRMRSIRPQRRAGAGPHQFRRAAARGRRARDHGTRCARSTETLTPRPVGRLGPLGYLARELPAEIPPLLRKLQQPGRLRLLPVAPGQRDAQQEPAFAGESHRVGGSERFDVGPVEPAIRRLADE